MVTSYNTAYMLWAIALPFRTLLRLIATVHILEALAEPQSKETINETF